MSTPPPPPTLGKAAPRVGAPVLEALRIRESLEREIEACAQDLEELVPRLRRRRAVYAGEWVVGVHVGGREDPGLPFSRLEFRLHIDAASETVRVTRCETVRNRDQVPDVFETELDDDGRRRLTGFVESAFLGFARRYFETR